ncbi:MAG: hypothetical protein MJZ61_05500, partial [Bacteroidales bacterium]|nr:hypothetical protein [Bacteroidales bacterium]
QSANLDTADISKYLDSFDNPKIDRTKLMQLLGKCDYPFMAIVNYKSKYVSDPVIGDETTSETVDARMQKVRKSYESGLLSSEIYTQEIKLVEYLRAFVNLKSSINSYILNYKNRVTDDFGVQYQQIFDNYMTQRRMYQSRISEFGSKPIFRNEFLPTYQSILTNSEVYLDGDMNLKNIKNIVKILLENGDGAAPASKFDAARNEQTLQILHSVEFPSDHKGVASLDNLDMMIAGLEAAQYKNVFQHKAQRLKGMRPSAEATAFCDKLQNEVNSSYCMSCRQQVSPIINDYMQRLDTENMRLAQQKLSSSVAAAKDRVFTILQKEQILQKHFKNDYGDTLPPDVEYIYEDFQKLQTARGKLQAVIKKDYSDQNSTQINILADNIDYESQDLAKILEHICSKMPELCE